MSFASRSNDHGAFVSGPDDGEPYWWLDTLTTVRVTGRAGAGGVDVVDHYVPPGYTPPRHVHRDQDEIFYILEGSFTVFNADDVWTAEPGSLIFLPRGVPHGFQVSDDGPGRTLLINAPAGFADVIADLGVPATARTLPGPEVAVPDPDTIAEITGRYGIGPPDDGDGR